MLCVNIHAHGMRCALYIIHIIFRCEWARPVITFSRLCLPENEVGTR